MSAYIRALPPTDASFGCDLEFVRCVACVDSASTKRTFGVVFRSVVAVGMLAW